MRYATSGPRAGPQPDARRARSRAGAVGQHDIEHDHIVVAELRALASLASVGGHHHSYLLFPHSVDHDVGQRPIVFHEKNAHDGKLGASAVHSFCPNTCRSMLFGCIGGRLRGLSGVACSGAGPKLAVTEKSLCDAGSSSMVRAPRAGVSVCATEYLFGLSSCTP